MAEYIKRQPFYLFDSFLLDQHQPTNTNFAASPIQSRKHHCPGQVFHHFIPFQTLNMFFYSPASLVCCLLLVQAGFAHPARACQAAPVASRAAYVITNEETNMVISLAVDEKGMLSAGSKVATGGAGAVSIDGSTNQPAGADPLVSQSSLTVVGNVSTRGTSTIHCKSDLNLFLRPSSQ
jgi:hypothetical protein